MSFELCFTESSPFFGLPSFRCYLGFEPGNYCSSSVQAISWCRQCEHMISRQKLEGIRPTLVVVTIFFPPSSSMCSTFSVSAILRPPSPPLLSHLPLLSGSFSLPFSLLASEQITRTIADEHCQTMGYYSLIFLLPGCRTRPGIVDDDAFLTVWLPAC